MAIYGIARSLESRAMGPAQLLPPIEDFKVSSRRACPIAKDLVEDQEARAPADLVEAVRALGNHLDRVAADIAAVFASVNKLDARERLELERNIDRVGGELQAIHRLLGVMEAAIAPRPIQLSLSDLVRGRFGPKAAFVSRELDLCVRADQPARFDADPQVAWAVVECFLHELPPGSSAFYAELRPGEGGPALVVGEPLDPSRASLMRCTLELGPRLDGELAIVTAIMRNVGWARRGGAEVQIDFAAA